MPKKTPKKSSSTKTKQSTIEQSFNAATKTSSSSDSTTTETTSTVLPPPLIVADEVPTTVATMASPTTKSKRKAKTPKTKSTPKTKTPATSTTNTRKRSSTPTKKDKIEESLLVDSDDGDHSESDLPSKNEISPQQAKKLEAMRTRMNLLERDNYIDRKGSAGGGGRSFSVNFNDDNEEWNNVESISSPKKGTKRKKKDDDEANNNSSTTTTSSKKKKTDTGKAKRPVKFIRRKFDQVLKMDKMIDSSSSYLSILTQPSILPTRKFCAITGFKANYTCPHSGDHFISVQAYEHVKKNHQLE